MKRIILLIFATTSLLGIDAQVSVAHHDLAIGVNGGYIFNKVAFTPKVNQKFYSAPSFGVTLRYTSERYYGLICAFQAEINYAGSGWKEDIYSSKNLPLPDKYSRNLTYIQIPVMANLGLGHIERGAKGYLVAGPQIGYLLSDKEKRSENWTLNEYKHPDRMNNITAQYERAVENKFEYGITAGLGCELSTRVGHFLIEGRYYMALSNLFGNSKSDPFPKSNNGTIVAKITYLIDVLH